VVKHTRKQALCPTGLTPLSKAKIKHTRNTTADERGADSLLQSFISETAMTCTYRLTSGGRRPTRPITSIKTLSYDSRWNRQCLSKLIRTEKASAMGEKVRRCRFYERQRAIGYTQSTGLAEKATRAGVCFRTPTQLMAVILFTQQKCVA
jgi:hypothetical protein